MICAHCRHDVAETTDCVHHFVAFPDGTELPAVKHARLAPCQDCGVSLGSAHHEHCQHEACPRCGGQMISCQCHDLIRRADA